MEEIRLITPSIEYGEEIMKLRQDIIDANDEDSFAGCGSLRGCTNIEDYLSVLTKWNSVDTCPAGGVPSSTYIAVRTSDNRVVGIVDLRHHIDHPILGLWGGHMGYSVRPSERGKGYAKEILKQNLLNCRDRKLTKVMVTCSRNNIASEKAIIANGGIFEKEVDVDGEYIKRYWIIL